MDQLNSTTQFHKGKHLSFEERVIIQIMLKESFSPNKIAVKLGRAPNTIRNEIKRGTVSLYNGKVKRYKASVGQAAYEANREHSCRHYAYLEKQAFIIYIEHQFFQAGISIDAAVGYARKHNLFPPDAILCTKTIYNYIDLGFLNIRNHHLPEKVSRKRKKERVRKNKKKLGRSIEERPAAAADRKEFGHWEADLVVGKKDKDDEALLTLLERQTREYLIVKISGKTAEAVQDGFKKIMADFGSKFSEVFKTITTDNGSEFASLSELEKISATLVYYAHPYSSWEKGGNERHNRLLRRFIPKGKSISDYSIEYIEQIELWCNSLPRKVLGYKTPDEMFEEKLDEIYAA